MRWLLPLLLCSTALAQPFFGGIVTTPPANGGSSPGSAVTQAQLQTQAAVSLFVNTAGSDLHTCTSPGAATACGTLQGAIGKVPKYVQDPVTITFDPGTYTQAASAAYVQGFTMFQRDGGIAGTQGATPTLLIGGSRQIAAVSAGLSSGTVASATQGNPGPSGGATNPSVWGTVTVNSSGWTANNLQGFWLSITGGTGAGQVRTIATNTNAANGVITIAGGWDTTPDGTSTFVIDDCAVTLTTGGAPIPFGLLPNRTDPIFANTSAKTTVFVSNNRSYATFSPTVGFQDICFSSADGNGAITAAKDGYFAQRVKFTNSANRKIAALYFMDGSAVLTDMIGFFSANQRFIQTVSPDFTGGANTWPQGLTGGSGSSAVSMRRSGVFAGTTASIGISAAGGVVDSQMNEFFGGVYGIQTGAAATSMTINTTGDHFDATSSTARGIDIAIGTNTLSTATIGVDGDTFSGTGATGSAIRWTGTTTGYLNFAGDPTAISSYVAGVVLDNPGLHIGAVAARGVTATLPVMSSVTCEYSILNASCTGLTTSKAAIEAATPKVFSTTQDILIQEFP